MAHKKRNVYDLFFCLNQEHFLKRFFYFYFSTPMQSVKKRLSYWRRYRWGRPAKSRRIFQFRTVNFRADSTSKPEHGSLGTTSLISSLSAEDSVRFFALKLHKKYETCT
jgi:hypothetical protein